MKIFLIPFTVSFQFPSGEHIFSVSTVNRHKAYDVALELIRKQNLGNPIKLNSIMTLCDQRKA